MIVIIFGFLLFETSLIFQIYSFNKQQQQQQQQQQKNTDMNMNIIT